MTSETAINRLSDSDRGRQALRDLRTFLDNGGMCLDDGNQQAVRTLLDEVWRGPRSATVRGMIREGRVE